MACSGVNFMVFSQVERLKLYTIQWRSVIVLLVYSLIERKFERVQCITKLFYYCVYQNHRLEQVCCYLCLELDILIWILRDWCWLEVMLGDMRLMPDWLPSSPPLAAQTKKPPKTHVTFYPYVLNLVFPIPWLTFYAFMTFTETPLHFFSHSNVTEMYTSKEHFGHEWPY